MSSTLAETADPAPAVTEPRHPRHSRQAPQARVARRRSSEAWVYLAIAVVVAVSWGLAQLPELSPRTEFGYWLGVAGGVMMLLLFAYPLRKRWGTLARLGKARHWFVIHMVLGILGPMTVLVHSSFSFGSLNAGVALVSMLVVAVSGVVGRFIYLHMHNGLGGQRDMLESLQVQLGLLGSAEGAGLAFAPAAQAALQGLHAHAGTPRDAWAEHLRRLFVLPWQLAARRRAIRGEVDSRLSEWADREGWARDVRRRRQDKALRLVDQHIDAVLRVAQYAAYARIFSLWHLLHVPFVFMMVISAIVHVVAVHAY